MPTFREAQTGLWEKYDPLQLATPEAFARDPELVWRWYQWRRELVAKSAPNAGHRALAELASLVPRLTLVTQNVDGLHQRAGSRDVIEYHGNLFTDKCAPCDHRQPAQDETAGAPPPRCPHCDRIMTPGVVLFGEMIPADAMTRADVAATDCDLFLVVGTSSQVYPAAGLAGTARASGSAVVEVNPEATPLSAAATHTLRAASGTALPRLVDAVAHRREATA